MLTKFLYFVPTCLKVAIAVGDLESREVSPRCRVWSEPSMVEAAAFEFSQTEDFLKVLVEHYTWYICTNCKEHCYSRRLEKHLHSEKHFSSLCVLNDFIFSSSPYFYLALPLPIFLTNRPPNRWQVLTVGVATTCCAYPPLSRTAAWKTLV